MMPSGSRRESSSRFLAAVLCVLAAGFVPARVARADDAPAGTMLALDSTRSHADFEVKVLWLIGVHGRFGQVQGSVSIDRVRGTAVADAQIGVEMIRMRKPGYETWVKSAEFFDAQHHPQIHFVSDPFPLGELQAGGEIGGTLRIRDIDRHVTMTLEPSACPEAIAYTCAVEASGSIRRSEFGMRSRRGTLSDNVDLGLTIYLAEKIPEPDRTQ